MSYRLQFADWVPFPASRVFAFFSDPENLPRLMPPATHTRIEGFQLVSPPHLQGQDPLVDLHAAGLGSIIDTSFRPIPLLSWQRKWTAVITEFEWNHHFVDIQQKGPFKRWRHRHECLEETRGGRTGTLVRDVIEYEVGFGPLGALANTLFLKRRLCEAFAHRQKVLPKLLAEHIRNNSAAGKPQPR